MQYNLFNITLKNGFAELHGKQYKNEALMVSGVKPAFFINGLLYTLCDMSVYRLYEVEKPPSFVRRIKAVGDTFFFDGKYYSYKSEFAHDVLHKIDVTTSPITVNGVPVIEIPNQVTAKHVLGRCEMVAACGNYLYHDGVHRLSTSFKYGDKTIRKMILNINSDDSATAFIGDAYVSFMVVK